MYPRSTCIAPVWVFALAILSTVLPSDAAFAQTPAPAQLPPQAQVQADPQQLRQELERLRQEFEAIRESYGQRLTALEARLSATGPVPAPTPAAAPPAGVPPPAQPETAMVPITAPPQTEPAPAPPQGGGAATTSKVFNPDMAVIGNFLGAMGKNDVNPAPALRMNEAEATFQAVVDPYALADFFFSFSPEGVEIEEGFLTLTSLPGGLLAKVGKMKQQVGKVNTQHSHSLSWIDRPLANENLLGGEEGLADSGISVSKLIAGPAGSRRIHTCRTPVRCHPADRACSRTAPSCRGSASFGLVVTSSVSIAGVLLVFCYLIVPAVAAMLYADSIGGRLAIGWVMGTIVSALGVYLSLILDLPTGATIVCTFGMVLVLMALARPLIRRRAIA